MMLFHFNNIAKINADVGIKIAIPMPTKSAEDAATHLNALESYDHLFKEPKGEETPQWIIEGLGQELIGAKPYDSSAIILTSAGQRISDLAKA